MKNELKVLKAIVKADLSKSEVKLLVFLMSRDEKVIEISTTEMAKKMGIQQSNLVRSLSKLKQNHVVGDRKNGIYIKSMNSWCAFVKVTNEEMADSFEK